MSAVPNALARQGLVPDPATKQLRDAGLIPAVVPYLKLYPLPNGRDFGDGTGELLNSPSRPLEEEYVMVRFDRQLSPRDSFFVRYNFDNGTVLTPNFLLAFGEHFVSRTQLVAFQEKRIISSTLVNTATFGLNRALLNLETIPLIPEAADSSLSFVPGRPFGQIVAGQGIPSLGTVSPVNSAYNTFQYADDLRWSKGRHNIQLGTLVSRMQNNIAVFGFAGGWGSYNFNGLTEFLQGRATNFGSIRPVTAVDPRTGQVIATDKMRGWRQINMGFYVQDDIKLTPTFTLNLGLRHESMTTISEVNGRQSNLRTPLDSQWSIGDPLFNNPGKLAFQPRVGVAWDPSGNGKTAVRAGFGVFNDVLIGVNYVDAGGNTFPWNITGTVVNPPPSTFPRALDLISRQAPLAVVSHMRPELRFPTKIHFNLNVQREVVSNTTITVAYVGSQSAHLTRRFEENLAIPQVRADGTKFYPPGLARRSSSFDSIQTVATDVTGSYHSLQISLNRRFSHGLQFQGSYTWSKSLDDTSQQLSSEGRNAPQNSSQFDNRKADRSYSNWDVRSNFIFNFTYELPFEAAGAGWAHSLLAGWAVNGIVTAASGPPFTVTTGVNRSRDVSLSTSEHPDLAPGRSNNPVLGGPDRYFDPTAFVLPELGTYGRVTRNTLRGPGFSDVDFALTKVFRVHEERMIQFRAEFFNILNHPNLGRADGVIFLTSGAIRGSVGRIISTVNTSRQIQFGLKILF